MNIKPKILALDFETSPQKGYFFGPIWDTNIIKVIEYEQVLCVAHKWNGEEGVTVKGQDDFSDFVPGVLNDKSVIEYLIPLIEEADIITAHNGDRFDVTVFNTRLLANGFNPVPITKTLDTKKIAKAKFHLPSNKLDDIADFLGLGRKLSTTKELWFGCERGDPESWKYMKEYCGNDVILQDLVLTRILPFISTTSNHNTIMGTSGNCPNPTCGSANVQKRGVTSSATTRFQRWQCQDCGKWSRSLIKELSLLR